MSRGLSSILKVFPRKQRRVKKLFEAYLKPLANLIDYPQLHTFKGAVCYGAERGLRNSAFHIQSILSYLSLVAKLFYPLGNGLIEFHKIAPILQFLDKSIG